jgi:hypothetical protein
MVSQAATKSGGYEIQCCYGRASGPSCVRDVHHIAIVVTGVSSGFKAGIHIGKIMESVNRIESMVE